MLKGLSLCATISQGGLLSTPDETRLLLLEKALFVEARLIKLETPEDLKWGQRATRSLVARAESVYA